MNLSWATSPAKDLRTHHARDAAAKAGKLPGDVSETEIPGQGGFRGGLLFTPRQCAGKPVIVYFHGGGFIAGSPETHRCVTAWLAKLSGLRVLSARYGLAPERHFPAQRDDAVAACVAASGLDCNTTERLPLVLAGDSAGACVALWAWQGIDAQRQADTGLRDTGPVDIRLADIRLADIRGLALFYGGFGHLTGASIARYGTAENGLDATTLAIMYGRLGGTDGTSTPFWPKDFARRITAPAYVLAAALDAVYDDSADLFAQLHNNDPANTFMTVDGQDHGFLKATGKDPVAMRELDRAARWISGLPGVISDAGAA